MAKKILIAMDSSKNAIKVSKFAARNIEKGAVVTLYHVFLKAPYEQVTDGERLPHHGVSFSGSTKEFLEWLKQKRNNAEQILEKARSELIGAGINAANITVKIDESKHGVVDDILNELTEGNYEAIIIGSGTRSGLKRLIKKKITDKIVNHAKDYQVLIADK